MKQTIIFVLLIHLVLLFLTVSAGGKHELDSCGGCPRGQYCALINGHPQCLYEPRPNHSPITCDSYGCPPGQHCVLVNGRPTCIINRPQPPQDCESITDLNQCPSPRCTLVSAHGCCGQDRKLCVTTNSSIPIIPPRPTICDYRNTICLKEILTNQIYEVPGNCLPKRGFIRYFENTRTCASLNCTARGLICGYGQTTECLGTKCCKLSPICVSPSQLYPPHDHDHDHDHDGSRCQPTPKEIQGLRIVCHSLNCQAQGKQCIGFFDHDCPEKRCCGPYARCEYRGVVRSLDTFKLDVVEDVENVLDVVNNLVDVLPVGREIDDVMVQEEDKESNTNDLVLDATNDASVKKENEKKEENIVEKKVEKEEKEVNKEEVEHDEKNVPKESHAVNLEDSVLVGSCELITSELTCRQIPLCRWATFDGCCGNSKSFCLNVNNSVCFQQQFPFGSDRPFCYRDLTGRQNYQLDNGCVNVPSSFKQYDPFIGTCESLGCRSEGLQCAIARLSDCQGNACCQDAPLCVPLGVVIPR